MSRPSRSYALVSFLFLAVGFLVAACGDAAAPGGDDAAPDGDGPKPGYVRFEPPPMPIGAGETRQYLHWVAAPEDHDRNIVDITGNQGPGGHHAILYTTKEVQPVGTTREFLNADQSEIQFVGGVGGEGGASVKLPPGVVFRVPAGRALVVQTHYFNPGDAALEGRTYIDVKFGVPAATDKVARFFASAKRAVSIPPHADTRLETSCVLKGDLPMLMFSNHMHELGVSISTTLTASDGTVSVLKDDPVWSPEWIFNPDYTSASVEAPKLLTAGSTLTTVCDYHNETDKTWANPDEMCVFFGFFLGDADVTCVDGMWYE